MTNSKNNGTAAKTATKKAAQPKNGNQSTKAEQSKKLHKNTTEEEKIFEIMAAEKELEETKATLENLELQKMTIVKNAEAQAKADKDDLEKLRLENLEIKTLKEQMAKNEKIFADAIKKQVEEVMQNAKTSFEEAAKKSKAELEKVDKARQEATETAAAAQEAARKIQENAELLKKELENSQKPTHSTAEEKLNRLQKANEISAMLERRKELFNSFKEATTGDEQDQFKIVFISSDGNKFDLAKSEIVNKLTTMTHEYMQNTIEETEKELLSFQI